MMRDLQTERDFARLIMESMGQGLTVIGLDGKYDYINPAFANMLGYQPVDLLGKTPFDVTPEEDHPTLIDAQEKRDKGEVMIYETRLSHRSGRLVYGLTTRVPLWRDGKIVGGITAVTDSDRTEKSGKFLAQE